MAKLTHKHTNWLLPTSHNEIDFMSSSDIINETVKTEMQHTV